MSYVSAVFSLTVIFISTQLEYFESVLDWLCEKPLSVIIIYARNYFIIFYSALGLMLPVLIFSGRSNECLLSRCWYSFGVNPNSALKHLEK
jgi:hypothetical protein